MEPILSISEQNNHILRQFPNFTCKCNRNEAIWRGTLQPRQFSQQYLVVISYSLGSLPIVRVVCHALASKAPYLKKNGTLELYNLQKKQWRRDMLIATTIIPWAASWLYYYELWLDTGKWLNPSFCVSDSRLEYVENF